MGETRCPSDPEATPTPARPRHCIIFEEIKRAPNSPHLEVLNEHNKKSWWKNPERTAGASFVLSASAQNHWPDAIKVADGYNWRLFYAPRMSGPSMKLIDNILETNTKSS